MIFRHMRPEALDLVEEMRHLAGNLDMYLCWGSDPGGYMSGI